MRAWVLECQARASDRPVAMVERPDPEPGPGEVQVRVVACGVCRTDLHIAEGDIPLRRAGVVPGHEIVGVVEAIGGRDSRFTIGDRVGIPWLRWTCGECRFCATGRENLCEVARFTGWDEDGGYAELAVVPEDYAYRIPEQFSDTEAAPLLCAGIIGFRALRASGVRPGGALGIYGFGGSAHIAAQIAVSEGMRVHVVTRSAGARRLALELGCASAGESGDRTPEPLDGAVIFAPAGGLVQTALSDLDRGATVAVAGIHLSQVPPLDYMEHLFGERCLRSVTANTRKDGEALMEAAARIPVVVTAQAYAFEDADRALVDLSQGRVSGAAVLVLH